LEIVEHLQSRLHETNTDLPAQRAWLDKLHQDAQELTAQVRALGQLLNEGPEGLAHWADRFAVLVRERRAELSAWQPDDTGQPAVPPAWVERCLLLADTAAGFASGMDFHFLYNQQRDLLSIGWNHATGQLDRGHYDLLASEACLTSFLCVARGEAPLQHWFQLGRPLTKVTDGICLVSWGGSMFEYLMPRLLLRPYADTLLAESWRTAVDRHIEYGRQNGVP